MISCLFMTSNKPRIHIMHKNKGQTPQHAMMLGFDSLALKFLRQVASHSLPGLHNITSYLKS